MTKHTAVQLFNNGEFEIELTPTDDTFTVRAPGLARAMGFRDAYRMVESIPAEEKGYTAACTPGGEQRIIYVTEAGFYRVLGQRQVGRIKNTAVREQVERFQNWIYREVLPAIRKHGRYEVAGTSYDPVTYTWSEAAAKMRQDYHYDMTEHTLRRLLRAAGVLKKDACEPKVAHRHMFWFADTHWEIHRHAVPLLLRKAEDVGRELREFRFIQTRLELDGVGSDEPTRQLGRRE